MIALINLLLILNTVEYSYMYRGTCRYYDSSGIVRFDCCFNFVEINGVSTVSTECLDGFQPLDGFKCRPCHRGFYGKKCFWKCYCKMDEKCDHVKGCLKVLPTTEAVTDHGHVEGTSFSAVEPTTEINSERGSSLSELGTTDEMKGQTGISDSKVPIPSIIGISTIVMLLVIVSLIWVCWKYKVPCKKRKQEEDPSNTETSFMHAEKNQVYFIN